MSWCRCGACKISDSKSFRYYREIIIDPGSFNRQQKLDLCALCHGGRLQKTVPSFEFTSGNALQDYFKLDTAMPDPDKVDVHGNQYAL